MTQRNPARLCRSVLLQLVWTLFIALFVGTANPCEGRTGEDDQILTRKTDMVLSALRSATWPDSAFTAADDPVVLSVLGENELAHALQHGAKSWSVHGRAVVIRQISIQRTREESDYLSEIIPQILSSHALFICSSESRLMDALLRKLGSPDVLTISDMESFIGLGGMIELTRRGDEISVNRNIKSIQSTQLKVDGELIQNKKPDLAIVVKAGMLLNFIRYTEWPDRSFANPDSAILICMLGDDEIIDILRNTVSDQRVHGRTVEVRRIPGLPSPMKPAQFEEDLNELVRQISASHVLFICNSERDSADAILRRLANANVLTISDIESFAERGGMLGLTFRRQRVAVEANPEKIQHTQMKVSSQLLRIAHTVKSRGN
jgi:hypothetical protein